jgi:glycosyltransferase involved in cell wall biosynthesis
MKARVVHLITKLEMGGAQANTLHTVRRLDRSRFSVALWAGDGGVLNPEAAAIPDLSFEIIPPLAREINPVRDLQALGVLRRKLKAEIKQFAPRPVILHTHSSKAGILGRLAARLAGVPAVVHTYHGFGFNPTQPGPLRGFFIGLERLAGGMSHALIAVSRANLEEAVRLGFGPREKIRLIRSGIAVENFTPRTFDRPAKRRELGLKPDAPVVTMVACLKPQKNPLDFARLAKQVAAAVPEAEFVLAGDGELRPDLESLVRELGLFGRFHLLGWRRDIPELLWVSDLLVLTSRWEGLPRVYLEALAAGLAVVGTRVDGAAEAVREGETGYLFEPGDVAGMAERVIALLRDPGERRRLAAAGRSRVEEFDIRHLVPAQEALYEELLGP